MNDAMNDYNDKLKAAVDELNNLPTTDAVVEHLKTAGAKAKRQDPPSMTCTLSVYLTQKMGLNPDLTRVRVAGHARVVDSQTLMNISAHFKLQPHVEEVERLFDDGRLPELEK